MSNGEPAEAAPERDVTALEQALGVRPGVFRGLLGEGDDWSFVVRTHALIEAAVSHVLAEVTGQPRLLPVFSRLELSNRTTGKLAFCKALGCFDEEDRRQIQKLSELRNELVHDIRKTEFQFTEWVSQLNSEQLSGFARAFGPGGDLTFGQTQISSAQFFRENPRVCIWLACLVLLSLAYQRADAARSRRERTWDLLERLRDLPALHFQNERLTGIGAETNDDAQAT